MSATVLVIDDDPQFRLLVQSALQAIGIQVVEAADGSEASAQVEKNNFDLLIVDGWLPDVNSIQWIADLRQAGNKVKILYVSAFVRDDRFYRQLINELEVIQIIHKPIQPEDLVDQVKSCLPIANNVTSKADLLEKAFEEHKRNYASELPGRLEEIAMFIEQAKTCFAESDALSKACLNVHKLRGTAAPYGFPRVGEAMAHIEDKLTQLTTLSVETLEDVKLELEQAIASLSESGSED